MSRPDSELWSIRFGRHASVILLTGLVIPGFALVDGPALAAGPGFAHRGLGAASGVGAGLDVTSQRLRQAGVTAAGLGRSDCVDFPPERPGVGRDGWVFQARTAGGKFRSVSLRFARPGGGSSSIAVSAANAGGSAWGSRLFNNGTQLWLSTPAGWTLRSGRAEVTAATSAEFDLIRTCWRPVRPVAGAGAAKRGSPPAGSARGGGPITAGRPASGGSPGIGAGGGRTADDHGGGSVTGELVVVIRAAGPGGGAPNPGPSRSRPGGSGGAQPGGAGGPGWLPRTGASVIGLAAVAVGLIGAGIAARRAARA